MQVLPYTLSDHHPIKVAIQLIGEPILDSPPKQGFALNTSLLKDEAIQAAIKVIAWYNEEVVNHASAIDR